MAFITNIELPSGMVAVNSYCSIQVNSSKPPIATTVQARPQSQQDSREATSFALGQESCATNRNRLTWNI